MEVWKDVIGYVGLYQVSNTGKVKRLTSGKFLKSWEAKTGYEMVSLWKNNKGKYVTIHRLLAIHFIDNPENKPTVNHIDGNKLNNDINNLEWTTYGENNRHAYEQQLKVVSDKVKESSRQRAIKRNASSNPPRSIPIIQYDLNMNKIAEYSSITEASLKVGVNLHTIWRYLKGKIESPKKYIWKYKEE